MAETFREILWSHIKTGNLMTHVHREKNFSSMFIQLINNRQNLQCLVKWEVVYSITCTRDAM